MAKKTNTVSAIKYLDTPARYEVQPVNVIFGDEPFFKRLAVAAIREAALDGDDADFSTMRFPGASAQWRDVLDELATVSLFGGGRLVVVGDADPFVSENRAQLEDYVARSTTGGKLVLVVSTWQKNTRLYKAVDANGLQIECRQPTGQQLVAWLEKRAQSEYKCKLAAGAADALVETIGPELGLLDQELDKLSLAAGADGEVTVQLVSDLVGGWRTRTVWEMLDAAYDGNAAAALLQLERLIHAGEHPVAIFAQVSSSLRRYAAVAGILRDAEHAGRRMTIRSALEAAGVKPFVLKKSEEQLRRLGRARAENLYQWLIETDLALKGASSAPQRARLVLEQLIVRIAAPAKQINENSEVMRHIALETSAP